ncbi:MAG: hypothetical protein HY289_11690 [Planctomycetes bacterium]|nr:hypothetical protein [Planctomycetota bacterium]
MNDDLREEYRFDYRKAKPNRFASKLKKGGRLVILDPELAEVFQDSKEVNAALKAIVKAMPKRTKKTA